VLVLRIDFSLLCSNYCNTISVTRLIFRLAKKVMLCTSRILNQLTLTPKKLELVVFFVCV
jgi:hypothetical protein